MQPSLQQFAGQRYLNLETFRKNGQSMPTPVWFVQAGEVLYVRTVAGSGKVKRINNNAQVNVMPCGQNGEPLGTWVQARARELIDEATYAQVNGLVIAKYGEMAQMFESQAKARGQHYTVIEIRLEE
jgi:hypothetical protein